MKALILQHSPDTPPGTTEDWLRLRKIPYVITAFYKADFIWPDLRDFDFLFVCGGAMNVDEEEKYAWMKKEKALILSAIKAKKKVVGLCLGAQLIADVLGAKVGKNKDWEVGWWPVQILPNDICATGRLMAFQYHGYAFETPKGAVKIAESPACSHQAYILDHHVLAFQFHPESTQDWVAQCSTEKFPEGPWVQSPQQVTKGNEYQKELQKWYFATLDRFFQTRHQS